MGRGGRRRWVYVEAKSIRDWLRRRCRGSLTWRERGPRDPEADRRGWTARFRCAREREDLGFRGFREARELFGRAAEFGRAVRLARQLASVSETYARTWFVLVSFQFGLTWAANRARDLVRLGFVLGRKRRM